MYWQRFIRMILTRSGQSKTYVYGETYNGYYDNNSIHVRNFPALNVGDKLHDKGTGFVYKVNALSPGDNEWIAFVNYDKTQQVPSS